ncbi:MAG: FG-GAP repeat protein [Sulfuricaulis sp.]
MGLKALGFANREPAGLGLPTGFDFRLLPSSDLSESRAHSEIRIAFNMTLHNRYWCMGLTTLFILASTCVSAATSLAGFPGKPAGVGQAKWVALQSAVATALPASTELTASDGTVNDRFGFSVSLSGTTALIGASDKTVGSNTNQGAAYVFTFNGSTWTQTQELIASDGATNDNFGISVALSGTTALIGAPNKTVGSNTNQGAAYIFAFNGNTWVQQQEMTASDGVAYLNFGAPVALSGTTALLGAYTGSNAAQGAAYVFTFNGSSWVQQQKLTATDGMPYDLFGTSVSLSGNFALVGAYSKTIGSNDGQGAAYVFMFDGTTWIQRQELIATDGAVGDSFGGSVALWGTTALVGAQFKTIGSNTNQGAAYVFTFNGSTWTQTQKLIASDGVANDYFGNSVALSGTTALIGAFDKTIGSNTKQGAAYVFTFNGSTWVQQQELTASDGAPIDYFGTSVALSGTTALVGAYDKMIGSNSGQGAAYLITPVGDTIFCDGFEGLGVCK